MQTKPKGTRKPLTAKAAKMKNPVHVHGIGVMEKEQAVRLFPDSPYTPTRLHKEEVAVVTDVLCEEVELEEKWVNHPDKPAEGLKRGQKVSIKGPAGKTEFGTYLQTQTGTGKPGHPKGHLVKHNSDGMMRWHSPETVFHDMSDYAHSEFVKEANEGTDHITMTVPLFIRCLEWAHEDAKDDVELHKFVEKVVAKGGVLATEDYEEFLPESVQLKEGEVVAFPHKKNDFDKMTHCTKCGNNVQGGKTSIDGKSENVKLCTKCMTIYRDTRNKR
jgi:hypothetical protein